MEHDEPVVVYTLTDPIRAQLILNVLKDEGISGYLGGIEQANTAGLPGTVIQVMVAAENADHAHKLLQSLEKSESKS